MTKKIFLYSYKSEKERPKGSSCHRPEREREREREQFVVSSSHFNNSFNFSKGGYFGLKKLLFNKYLEDENIFASENHAYCAKEKYYFSYRCLFENISVYFSKKIE